MFHAEAGNDDVVEGYEKDHDDNDVVENDCSWTVWSVVNVETANDHE